LKGVLIVVKFYTGGQASKFPGSTPDQSDINGGAPQPRLVNSNNASAGRNTRTTIRYDTQTAS